MRRILRFLPALVALVLPAIVSYAQQVSTDYDHHANFERYHTYSWMKVHTEDPLWQSRITEAVDRDLQAKGWQRQESGGDVVLTAVGATRNQQEYQTFYDGFGGWRWRGWGPGETTTTVQNYRVGTLVLDMYDAQSKQLLWRGTAQDTLSDKPEKNEHKLQESVDKMFKNFPPRVKDGDKDRGN
jgi:Domain of unknown function (DUF4136)